MDTTATPAEIDTELAAVNAEIAATLAKLEALKAKADALQAKHDAQPWNRFYVVADGHIHSGRTCKGGTIGIRTSVQWATDLSGKTEAEAVAALGTVLCTHCFPSAPVALTTKPATVNPNRCPGSGKAPVPGTAVYGRRQDRAKCTGCGTMQIETSTLTIRAHNRPKGK